MQIPAVIHECIWRRAAACQRAYIFDDRYQFAHNQSYSIGQSLRPLSTRVKAEDLINFIHRVRDLRCLPKQKYLWGWLADMCRSILWL